MAAFTTIAAGIGLAATAGTTAMSFAQAGKQRKLMKEAEKAADTAMQEARKKLEVNVFDKLAINKEVYRDQREEFGRTAAAAIQAGVESERCGSYCRTSFISV
jgi:acyl-CoA hydrolase